MVHYLKLIPVFVLQAPAVAIAFSLLSLDAKIIFTM
jgi:hypothetical protein